MRLRRAGVLGLGKAGSALCASLLEAGVTLSGVFSRSAARRQGFATRCSAIVTPRGRLDRLLHDLTAQDCQVLFLAVPDDALGELASRLVRAPAQPPVIVHLSGARGHEALDALGGRAALGSFHPLAALSDDRPIPLGTLVALEATRARERHALTALATAMGLSPTRVPSSARAQYHLGAVTSANLAVALLQRGIEHLQAAGVDEELARVSLARLLMSTARGAELRPLPEMMTGPIARGDVSTVGSHLEVLQREPQADRQVYRLLSLALVEMARLPPARKTALRTLLDVSTVGTSAPTQKR
ncbi:MAG: Rossmann-like and DUF2520 domain-containing protein [Myxococcota bacterium]